MVDFSLTKKQIKMQDLAHDFADKYVNPVPMKIDKISDPQKAFPTNLFKKSFKILGGRGYLKDMLIEKLYRDAKAPEIYKGANESLKITISQFIN